MRLVQLRGRAALWPVLVFTMTVAVAGAADAGTTLPGSRTTSARQTARQTAAPRQELALLLRTHVAVSAPGDHGVPLATLAERRPITGERTSLPVVGQLTGRRGVHWLRVLLPGRPNGHSGWIKENGTRLATTPWRIVVTLHERRIAVLRDGLVVRSFAGVVGKRSTPTPTGAFFVEEAVELSAGEPGGPFALALSARSTVLQEFDGGPGQIALHGLMNVGGTPGTAASHGCLRLGNDAMRWLVMRIGPGVPVTIER